jgi:hypothetical protein
MMMMCPDLFSHLVRVVLKTMSAFAPHKWVLSRTERRLFAEVIIPATMKPCTNLIAACFLLAVALHWPIAGSGQEPNGGGGAILDKPTGIPEDDYYWSSVISYLVFEKSSRASLELTPQQEAELRILSNSNGSIQETQRIFSSLRTAQGLDGYPLTDELRIALSQQTNNVLKKRLVEKAGSVLLPHQMMQLTQGAIGYVRREHGDAGLLSSRFIRKELGISDEQLSEIKAKAEEEARKLEAKKAELSARAEKNILAPLTESQREKLKELEGGVVAIPDVPVSTVQGRSRARQPVFDPDKSDYWTEVMSYFVNGDGFRKYLELTAQQEADLNKLDKAHNSEAERWRETEQLWKAAGLETEGEITLAGEYKVLLEQANRTCNRRFIDNIDTVLLPHQMELLIRQSLAFVRGRHGNGGLLKSSFVREELGISDKQFNEIKAIAVQEASLLKEKFAELEAQARENILTMLTEAQREKLKQLENGR